MAAAEGPEHVKTPATEPCAPADAGSLGSSSSDEGQNGAVLRQVVSGGQPSPTARAGAAAGEAPGSRPSTGTGQHVRPKVVFIDKSAIRQSLHDLGGSFRGLEGFGTRTKAKAASASVTAVSTAGAAPVRDSVGGSSSKGGPEGTPDGRNEDLEMEIRIAPGDRKRKQQLFELFSRYDSDSSGHIDHVEVVRMLRDLGLKDINAKHVREFVRETDLDNNDQIDFTEFCHMYELLASGQTFMDDDAEATDVLKKGAKALGNAGRMINRLKQQKKAMAKDIYATDRQIIARARIHELLYSLSVWAPDYVYRRWWDVAVLFFVVFNVVVPSACLVIQVSPNLGLAISEGFVSAGLLFDMGVNLNTARPLTSTSFALETNKRAIFISYLKTGFAADLLSSAPVDLVLLALGGSDDLWRWVGLLRCLAAFRFSRLFVMTNRGNMDPDYVRFYFWTIPMLQGCFKLSILLHILTLGRILVSPSPGEEGCEDFGQDACADSAMGQYLYAAFWLWALLTTQGSAALESPAAYAYAALVLVLSLLLQGYVVADMSALVIKSNVNEQINDSMRSTLAIMKHYSIPPSLQQEVLSFQYHSLQQNAAASLAQTLQRLPTQMQREVGLYVKVDLVTNVPMFRELASDCRLAVANCLEQADAEPQEFIIQYGTEGNEMFFMMHGFADVIVPNGHDIEDGTIVATIRRGDYFGEVALLLKDQKRTASVQALTYCDLFRLHQGDFSQVYQQFAELSHRMTAEAKRRGLLQEVDTAADSAGTDRPGSRASSIDARSTVSGAVSDELAGSRRSQLSTSLRDKEQPEPRRQSKVLGLKEQLIYTRPRHSVLGVTAEHRSLKRASIAIAAAPRHRPSINVARRASRAPVMQVRTPSVFGDTGRPEPGTRPMIRATSMRQRSFVRNSFVRSSFMRSGSHRVGPGAGGAAPSAGGAPGFIAIPGANTAAEIGSSGSSDDEERDHYVSVLGPAAEALFKFEDRMSAAIEERERRLEQLLSDEVERVMERLQKMERFVVDALIDIDDELRKGDMFAGLFAGGERVDLEDITRYHGK
eukprot:TRINITY_DN1540_c0_g1_i2.p1 TRINITY_DN1540_c0_g1~~TRINITY_DN1540_c0_g1_i2.p1  ORF type:complete len:1052 (+),score=327.65 TRINITY_DN1540_c0_g1_i2:206-3361(+)